MRMQRAGRIALLCDAIVLLDQEPLRQAGDGLHERDGRLDPPAPDGSILSAETPAFARWRPENLVFSLARRAKWRTRFVTPRRSSMR
jgi:hypothetical protein